MLLNRTGSKGLCAHADYPGNSYSLVSTTLLTCKSKIWELLTVY